MCLPCVVCNATGPIHVRWYHSQNGNPVDVEDKILLLEVDTLWKSQNRVLLLDTQTALKVFNFTDMN